MTLNDAITANREIYELITGQKLSSVSSALSEGRQAVKSKQEPEGEEHRQEQGGRCV